MIDRKQKRGVSVLVGYVLLIVFAIVISVGVYSWLKSYVPAESLSCKDGVSFFVKEADFNNSLSQQLNITIRNNGRFSIAGYFIHATNNSNQTLAVIDLSQYLNTSYEGIIFGNSIQFSPTSGNTFKPGEEVTHVFDVPTAFGELYSLDIVPTIFQTADNKERFVSCSEEKVRQIIGQAGSGGSQCTPNCSGRVCGDDGCGGLCSPGCDSQTEFCDYAGQCISTSCTPTSDPCGIQTCGVATNGTCGTIACGSYGGGCQAGFSCNATSQCEPLPVCGNNIVESGEQCDDNNTVSGDGCSSTCQNEICGDGIIQTTLGEECDDDNNVSGDGCSNSCAVEFGWTCTGQPSSCQPSGVAPSCNSYCVYLGYSLGSCTNSPGNCASGGGTYVSQGDQWCTGGAQADTCCCGI